METIERGALSEIERAILDAMTRYGAAPEPGLPTRRTGVDYTHGVCRCWVCRPLRLPAGETTWMRAALARHVLRMRIGERMAWLAEYHLRHGTLPTEELKVCMALERRTHLLSFGPVRIA